MSHHMLSPNEYKVLTSQNNEIKGISEYKSRIIEKADLMIESLRIIARSETFDQEFKDNVFPKVGLTGLINNIMTYDNEATALQERNKQNIAIDLMKQSLRYFQDRHNEVFMKRAYREFEVFAKDIKEFTEKQIAETRAQELYKTRKSLQPPLLYPAETYWKIVCLECHEHLEGGETEEDVIKRLRHTKNCTIHKEKKRLGKGKDTKERIYWQYYRTIPPVKSKKS